MVNNMHSDPLQKLEHSKVCLSLEIIYADLYEHIIMRKHISFKIRNHLPAILPNQIYNTTTGVAVKLQWGE